MRGHNDSIMDPRNFLLVHTGANTVQPLPLGYDSKGLVDVCHTFDVVQLI